MDLETKTITAVKDNRVFEIQTLPNGDIYDISSVGGTGLIILGLIMVWAVGFTIGKITN